MCTNLRLQECPFFLLYTAPSGNTNHDLFTNRSSAHVSTIILQYIFKSYSCALFRSLAPDQFIENCYSLMLERCRLWHVFFLYANFQGHENTKCRLVRMSINVNLCPRTIFIVAGRDQPTPPIPPPPAITEANPLLPATSW